MSEIIRSERLGEQYERVIHASGLSILLYPKKSVTTYATLVLRYGAQDTTFLLDGVAHRVPDGTAHFLENKMFERFVVLTKDEGPGTLAHIYDEKLNCVYCKI